MDAQYTISDFEKFLKKKFPNLEIPDIQAILVFTNPKARLETNGSPISALPLEKLKDFIRKRGKEKPVPLSLIQEIQKGLPEEDLT